MKIILTEASTGAELWVAPRTILYLGYDAARKRTGISLTGGEAIFVRELPADIERLNNAEADDHALHHRLIGVKLDREVIVPVFADCTLTEVN